jgi:deaminated glutathione amidase
MATMKEPATIRIAAVQMVSTPVVQENLDTATRLVAAAAAQGAQLVALPEYFCLMGQRDEDKLAIAEAPGEGPIQAQMAALARAQGLWLLGGTVPLKVAGDAQRVFNSSLVWGPQGQVLARYDKLHLFAFDNGRERYDEGRVLRAGDEPVRCAFGSAAHGRGDAAADVHADAIGAAPGGASGAVEPAPWQLGLSICYDLRFPELYRRLNEQPGLPPCDVLAVPAAFTHTTGQAHWELLLRARAVENQCYVLAAAQGGLHRNGRRTFGHSMVVGPWGEVMAVQAEGEGVVCAEISRERLAQVRQQLPALAHRRL